MKFFTTLVLTLGLGISLVSAAPGVGNTHIHRAVHGGRSCGTHISSHRKAAVERKFAVQRKARTKTAKLATQVINVYFHVVVANATLAGGWVPKSQITKQMAVLNRDYKNAGIQFRLVNTTRTLSKKWFSGVSPDGQLQTDMKNKLRKGGPESLNVYTVGFQNQASNGLLGYATFPADYKGLPKDDGVVLQYATLPGGSNKPFNQGRTLTHEAGHWVGLYHTFEGESCTASGDMVSDTPAQSVATSGCPIKKPDSCPGQLGLDPIHNFMDYSDDACMTMFSKGQITRLQDQLRTFRNIDV
ncbi:hypothetical protein GALMADRAFT_1032396 [Galerina marginata CBS 339.88]|uniref:Peptidase M43 pregnancy-associated plasma-A domain-containing protein n=1 Tax=Galerina marginata (strain CBS 339.88) TaxID=685588 RepID=A0A067SPW3_GALM3|nr:hypothetical protein GALMADRAFT_1032396 [Galerina marginata CBS 339.88]